MLFGVMTYFAFLLELWAGMATLLGIGQPAIHAAMEHWSEYRLELC